MKRYLAVLVLGVALGVGLAVPITALASNSPPIFNGRGAMYSINAMRNSGEMANQRESLMPGTRGNMGMMGMMMGRGMPRSRMGAASEGPGGMPANCQKMMDQDHDAMHQNCQGMMGQDHDTMHQMMEEMMQSGGYEEMHRACHESMGS